MPSFPAPGSPPSAFVRPIPPLVAMLAALLAVLAGAALRQTVAGTLGGQGVFLVFLPAVVVGAALGGWGPGLAAALSGLAAGVFLAPWSRALGVEAALFVVTAAAVTVGGEWVRRAHRELATRETHLRLILETIPEAMILIDERGLVSAFSPAAERLFGWPAEDILGRNVNLLMPSPYREAHDGYLQRYYRTGQRRIVGLGRIVVGLRRDGSTFPMELAVGEMRTAEGRFFTGFVRDLTERQQAEARLQELQEDLARVSRLTSLGEMASALAHELNQPLTAIANYMKGSRRLLAGDPPDVERVSEAIDMAADQALRAGVIIRRLREFVARGETERRIEDLPKLVEEASALALVGAREHGVAVQFRIDPAVGPVLADKVQIQQVVLNLIRNALDAMEETPVRDMVIQVATESQDLARITVSDTGSGIAPETAEQLFQPFVTTKRTGMGVGLSISRTIVEAHGGRIWFERNAAGGTDFSFTLQRAHVGDEARETPEAPAG